MATFVLVHGAMHGGWCWRDVRARLQARGHAVATPTLTGQGERHASLAPDVGLGTHVDDVAQLLWFEDLTDVTLVLHSYAGMLAGPLADRAEGRLRTVVYLGAFFGDPGQCLLDVEPPEVAARYRAQAAADGEGWFLPATQAFLTQWGVADEALAAWVGPRLTDFPFRCQTEAAQFDPAPLAALRQVYVAHTDPPLASLDRFFAAAVARGWETHELRCGHDMMLAAPNETTDLLERIAGAG